MNNNHKKSLLIKEIDNLYNEGNLSFKDVGNERERINHLTAEEVDAEIKARGIEGNKKIKNNDDSKSNESISYNEQIKLLTSINSSTKSIKFWISFWSWIGIIGLAYWLILLVSALN